jgi:hypothetical protein
MKNTLFLTGLIGLFSFTGSVFAEFDASGYIEAEARYYPQEGVFEEQDDAFGSLASELDIYWRSEDESQTVQFKPFGRITTADDGNRSHADVRELYYRFAGSGWQVLVGANKVFWGVTESAHLVDIVNQTDNVESTNGEEKLGQPMVGIGFEGNWGNLDMYVLPYFRERKYTAGSERPLLGVPSPTDNQKLVSADIDYNKVQYQHDDEEEHVDYAIRWASYFGNLDVGLSYFSGTSRDPLPFFSNVTTNNDPSAGPNSPAILPSEYSLYYEQLWQVGLELQYLLGDWALKFEGTSKNLDSGDYNEFVTGFEYTFSDLNPWGQDVGILLEYLWNDRDAVSTIDQALTSQGLTIDSITDPLQLAQLEAATTVPGEFLSPFEDDVFLGFRFTLNDIDSTDFLAGFIYDIDSGTTIGSFEGSTRFGDNVRASLNVYLITDVPEDSSFFFSRRDDLVEAKVQWYF